MDDSPMSVHIWMSLYDWVCMRGCGWQVTANPIIDSLQKAISDLVNTCKGLVVVCVNRDVAFHGGRGDLRTIANKVSEICKAAGALVTENDRLWRVVHTLTGKNYKIPGSSNLQHFLLKRLLIEKSIDAVAPSNAFVCELEGTCVNEPDLRFNIPKNMEESKVKFEYKPTFTTCAGVSASFVSSWHISSARASPPITISCSWDQRSMPVSYLAARLLIELSKSLRRETSVSLAIRPVRAPLRHRRGSLHVIQSIRKKTFFETFHHDKSPPKTVFFPGPGKSC